MDRNKPTISEIYSAIEKMGGRPFLEAERGLVARAPKGCLWAANLQPLLPIGDWDAMPREQWGEVIQQLSRGVLSGEDSGPSGVTINQVLDVAYDHGAIVAMDKHGVWHILPPKAQRWVAGFKHNSLVFEDAGFKNSLTFEAADINDPEALDELMEQVKQGLEPEPDDASEDSTPG